MTAATQWLLRISVVVVVTLGVLVYTTRAQPPSSNTVEEGAVPVNTMCPVMTDEPIDPRFTVEYNGVLVGLCCRRCRTQFEANPDEFLANLPVSVPRATEGAESAAPDPPRSDRTEDISHGHDAAHHQATQQQQRSRIIMWLGRFHPPSTHVPIGLLLGAAIAELAFMVSGRELFRHASVFCLTLSTAGAVTAAALGWSNAGVSLWDSDPVLATHRWLGTASALLSLVSLALLARSRTTRSRLAFRITLSITTACVLTAGFFGGAIVYGLNHYAW